MLKLRIISALVGTPLLFVILYAGGVYWWGLFILLGMLAIFEYYRMMKIKGYIPLHIPGLLVLAVLLVSAVDSTYILPGFLLAILLLVIIMIFRYPKIDLNAIALSFFGAFYIGLLLSFALKIFYLDNRFWIATLVLILTWASDTGAYFAGKNLGRHSLAPEISPNKTIEGSMGGILASILAAFVFFNIVELGQINTAYVFLLGISASVFAQLGDLTISGFKRFFGVKDAGQIIPGHGGVLDRFDSFLLVLPIVYYFFVYLI